MRLMPSEIRGKAALAMHGILAGDLLDRNHRYRGAVEPVNRIARAVNEFIRRIAGVSTCRARARTLLKIQVTLYHGSNYVHDVNPLKQIVTFQRMNKFKRIVSVRVCPKSATSKRWTEM